MNSINISPKAWLLLRCIGAIQSDGSVRVPDGMADLFEYRHADGLITTPKGQSTLDRLKGWVA